MSRAENLISHYEALGLSKSSALTVENVKRAYKKSCLKYHPDVTKLNLMEARERFAEVQGSYNTLMFHLKKAGGELPANILTPAAFFSLIGMGELADQTQENIIEINLKRAAAAVGADFKDGGTIGMLDAKIMKKLTFWARGLSGDERVLDRYGHFNSNAIENIMEMAWVYKTSSTEPPEESRNSFFDRLEREFSDEFGDEGLGDPDYSERMFSIISEWVHANYVLVGTSKWTHKTALKEKRGEIIARLGTALLKIGCDRSEVQIAIEQAYSGSSSNLLTLVDVRSESVPTEKKLTPQAQNELKAIARKASVSLSQLSDAATSGDHGDNLVLNMMLDRVRELFVTEVEDRGSFYKKLKETKGQLEAIEKIMIQ